MDLSQQSITGREFELNRRGYDPDEVDAHLRDVADAVASREDEIGNLKRTIAELQAKVRDADESEEALRLTLKAAAHAKEELLADAREQAAATQQEASENATQLVAEAQANARQITDGAQARADSMLEGATNRAREIARAALAESELLVVRIEQLRAQVGAAEESLRALGEDANPRLEEARQTLDEALEAARSSAENPELLAAAVRPEQSAVPGESAEETPAAMPQQPVDTGDRSGDAPATQAASSQHDEAEPPSAELAGESTAEAGGAGRFTEPLEQSHADDGGPSEPVDQAHADDGGPSEPVEPEAVPSPVESSSDISDKVDRLLEELREVT